MKTIANSFGVTEETYRGYLWLLKAANYSGYVCRSEASLIRELGHSQATLISLLSELESARLIEIKTPLPFLVLRLLSWSDKGPKSCPRVAEKSPDITVPQAAAPFPLKRYLSGSSSAAADINNSGEGVQGEGDLKQAVMSATGWADHEEVRLLIGSHPPALIRRVLTRLAQVPDKQIRTSRIALFRFLVKRFGQSNFNDHDPPNNHHSA